MLFSHRAVSNLDWWLSLGLASSSRILLYELRICYDSTAMAYARPTIWNLNKIQMAKQKFRLISGLAELTRETKITAEMRLVANIFGWNTVEPHFKYKK